MNISCSREGNLLISGTTSFEKEFLLRYTRKIVSSKTLLTAGISQGMEISPIERCTCTIERDSRLSGYDKVIKIKKDCPKHWYDKMEDEKQS